MGFGDSINENEQEHKHINKLTLRPLTTMETQQWTRHTILIINIVWKTKLESEKLYPKHSLQQIFGVFPLNPSHSRLHIQA